MKLSKLEQMKARLAADQKAIADRQRQLNLAIRKEEMAERKEQVKQLGEVFADLLDDLAALQGLTITQHKALIKIVRQHLQEVGSVPAAQ